MLNSKMFRSAQVALLGFVLALGPLELSPSKCLASPAAFTLRLPVTGPDKRVDKKANKRSEKKANRGRSRSGSRGAKRPEKNRRGRALQSVGTGRGLASTGTNRALTRTGTDRALQSTGKDRPLASTGTDRALQSTGRDRGLASMGTNRGLASMGHNRGLASMGHNRGLASVGTDRGLASVGRDRGLASGNDRGFASVGRDRGLASGSDASLASVGGLPSNESGTVGGQNFVAGGNNQGAFTAGASSPSSGSAPSQSGQPSFGHPQSSSPEQVEGQAVAMRLKPIAEDGEFWRGLDVNAASLARDAVNALRDGDPFRAEGNLYAIRLAHPESVSVRLHYALTLVAIGRFQQASQELTDAVALEPTALRHTEPWSGLYAGAPIFDLCREKLKTFRAAFPDDPDALVASAFVDIITGNAERAEKTLQRTPKGHRAAGDLRRASTSAAQRLPKPTTSK